MTAVSCRLRIFLEHEFGGFYYVAADLFHRFSARDAAGNLRNSHRISTVPLGENFSGIDSSLRFEADPNRIGQKPATVFPEIGKSVFAR